jgi:DMSO reductase family type II enzyme chaperone
MGESPAVTDLLEQAATWRYLHHLFRFPSPTQWSWLRGRETREAWRLLAARCKAPDTPAALRLRRSYVGYEQDFLSAFEVGAPNPPCPLIESHWNRRDPVPKVLHENMLFYKRFGLELRSSANETADHLRHQLEFLQYLCLMEARARADGSEEIAAQTAWARTEYLERHVASWVPRAQEKLGQLAPRSWPATWMRLLSSCVEEWATASPPRDATVTAGLRPPCGGSECALGAAAPGDALALDEQV